MNARVQPKRTYAGRSPSERAGERRARLCAAGLALIGTKGYAPMTIEAVCSRARVTARHFYEAFESREALLRAVYDQVIDTARRDVLAALAGAGDDPRQQIAAGVTAFVHSYLDDPRHVRIACVEIVGVSRELELHRRGIIHEFAGMIQVLAAQQARRARAAERDWSLTALALAGATNELLIEWTMRAPPPPAQGIIDELVGLYAAALGRHGAI